MRGNLKSSAAMSSSFGNNLKSTSLKVQIDNYNQKYDDENTENVKEIAFLSSNFDEFKSKKGHSKGMQGYAMDFKYIYFWDDHKIWTCEVNDLKMDL